MHRKPNRSWCLNLRHRKVYRPLALLLAVYPRCPRRLCSSGRMLIIVAPGAGIDTDLICNIATFYGSRVGIFNRCVAVGPADGLRDPHGVFARQ